MRAYAPDLILLDLRLPWSTASRPPAGSARSPTRPILVLTGSNDPELLGRAAAAGTSGHVLKPFSEHGLLSAVKSRLAEHESYDFHLRCIVDSMVRDGADEKSIVRALERLHPSHTTRRTLRTPQPEAGAAAPCALHPAQARGCGVSQPASAGSSSTLMRWFPGAVSA